MNQMKKQSKIQGKELNETEVSNLSAKEFNVTVIRILMRLVRTLGKYLVLQQGVRKQKKEGHLSGSVS